MFEHAKKVVQRCCIASGVCNCLHLGYPHPRIGKCYFCQLIVSIGRHTNQPVACSAITDLLDALSIHIQIDIGASETYEQFCVVLRV
jgi:hypothetical protein